MESAAHQKVYLDWVPFHHCHFVSNDTIGELAVHLLAQRIVRTLRLMSRPRLALSPLT